MGQVKEYLILDMGTVLQSFILYTEVFEQALLLLFGTCIGATHTHKSYKQMIVMLNVCVNRCHLYCKFCSI